MTIKFSPDSNIPPNQRGELQLWIEQSVDRDTDFYLAAVSQAAGDYVMMRANWHRSPSDPQEHLTGNVIINNQTIGAAHVYRNGQVTMFPVDDD